MAKDVSKNRGLVKKIQRVLLDAANFLRILVQDNLQKIIKAEFSHYIQAASYGRTEMGRKKGKYKH